VDADDRLLYDTGTGALYYDADGTGPTAPVLFAQLGTASHPNLVASDFVIVA
jgi:Ca2+-binding RTX toxin-like protein